MSNTLHSLSLHNFPQQFISMTCIQKILLGLNQEKVKKEVLTKKLFSYLSERRKKFQEGEKMLGLYATSILTKGQRINDVTIASRLTHMLPRSDGRRSSSRPWAEGLHLTRLPFRPRWHRPSWRRGCPVKKSNHFSSHHFLNKNQHLH